ncbi:MAG: peptidase S41, partial [Pirellulales bacterium]
MSRRNLNLLLAISIVSFACYKKADSAYRSHYGRMFGTFVEVLSQIDANYVEKVDDRDLFEGALTGMVGRLDRDSAYIPPAESTEFRESLDQQFGGIGIEVSWDPQTKLLTVLSPLVGSPAYEAGV